MLNDFDLTVGQKIILIEDDTLVNQKCCKFEASEPYDGVKLAFSANGVRIAVAHIEAEDIFLNKTQQKIYFSHYLSDTEYKVDLGLLSDKKLLLHTMIRINISILKLYFLLYNL